MRRTREEAERTRREILDAALAVFSHRGYEATRLDEVADLAGVTRGAIYHHFDGKRGLFETLLDDAARVGNLAIDRAVDEGDGFLSILRGILVAGLELLEDDLRFRQVTALSLTSADHPLLAERRRRDRQELVETLSRFFAAGIEAGELDPGLDPGDGARALIGLQTGLAALWLADRESFAIQERAAAIGDLFARGIAADKGPRWRRR